MIDLNDFANEEHITTLAEAIGTIYKGKTIQVYWGESGGTTSYADYDVSQNMYLEGVVLWGRGDVFAVEVTHTTKSKIYKKQVLFNAWSVTLAAEKVDEMTVTSIFRGRI